jgi:iron(III) transport system permease protein
MVRPAARSLPARLGDAAALVALALLCVAPVAAALSALREAPPGTWELVGSERVRHLIVRTALLGVATALGTALVGVPVACLLARGRGAVRGLLATLLPLPMILPPWMAGMAWARAVTLSGFWGAMLLLTAALWPLVALFALRGLRAAARAGDAARLARGRAASWLAVELPLAAPSILSGMVLVFVLAATDFGVVDFLSFNVPEPFTVLSSEIFTKWSRLGSGAQAAAVSLPAVALGLLALVAMLVLERPVRGRYRGSEAESRSTRRLGLPAALAVLALVALMVSPLVVMLGWAGKSADPLAVLSDSRDEALRSVLAGLGAGAIIALVGLAVARVSLRGPPLLRVLVLGAALLPLAVPGVLFAVGVVRLGNHPANPLAAVLYRSPALLVLGLAGRFLPFGVLAARALLLRQDEGPAQAARLAGGGALRRWLRIELPLALPALGLALALGYLLSLRELDLATLVPAGNATLVHQLYSLVHIASDDTTALLCLLLMGLVLLPAAAARLLGVPGVDGGPRP